LTDILTELLREGEPVSVPELPQGQKRPLSTYQASTMGQGGSSSSLNNLHQQHQHHTPPTPPPVWEWNNRPNPNPSYPIMPNNNVNMANGYLPNLDPAGLDLSGINSNANGNINSNTNMNGNGNGNGGPVMDSFFDHGLFGGLTPTVGMGQGMDGTHGNGNEDDLWTQLFGTFPYVHPSSSRQS